MEIGTPEGTGRELSGKWGSRGGKLTFIELVMPSNHLILCCFLLLLPSIFPSIRVFLNVW